MLDVPVSSHTEHQWLTLHSQAHRPAPPPPTTTTMNTNVTLTTPEMTPSPTLKPEVRRDHDISPVTPLPPPTDQNRPFSYEAPAPETQTQTQTQTQAEAAPAPAPAPPTQTTPAPQSEVSQVSPAQAQAVPDVQIHAAPETPAAMETQQALPSPSAPQASTPTIQTEEPHASPLQEPTPTATTTLDPTTPTAAAADDLAPFAPLTYQTYTHLPSSIPRITSAHLRCYTSHADSVWSNNRFQSLGCMVCASNAPDRKWTCAWCSLRVCVACSDKLVRVPGRRLDVLLKEREGAGADEAGKEVEGGVGDVDVNTDADEYAALIYGADDDEALQREREQAQRMSSINEEEVHERGRSAERRLRVD
jgi:hypothetical protein